MLLEKHDIMEAFDEKSLPAVVLTAVEEEKSSTSPPLEQAAHSNMQSIITTLHIKSANN